MTVRAKSNEELKPLVQLCKTGHLFEVQSWITAGHPVNPPEYKGGNRPKTPLEVTIANGFHSLMVVLLESGATINYGFYNGLEHALMERRLDLIKLLVKHGADIRSVSMIDVFDTWDPEIMEYFIEKGADVETNIPFAAALCERIRTALGVFKRHKKHFPSFQEQLNIALRYHCREGDLKWVSLTLWAGADPFAKGADISDLEPDPDEEQLCALEYAALYDQFEVFKLKKIKVRPDHPIASKLMRYACQAKDAGFLIEFLENGFDLTKQPDRGTSLVQACLRHLPMIAYDGFWLDQRRKDIDSSKARETMKKVYLLASLGAQWNPSERYEINDARRALLKMTADYTTEFAWIMSQFKACSRENIERLLKTPAIRKHVAEHQSRIDELIRQIA